MLKMTLIPIEKQKSISLIDEESGNMIRVPIMKTFDPPSDAYKYAKYTGANPFDGSIIFQRDFTSKFYRFAQPGLYNFRLRARNVNNSYLVIDLFNESSELKHEWYLFNFSGETLQSQIANFFFVFANDNYFIGGSLGYEVYGARRGHLQGDSTSVVENPNVYSLGHYFGEREIIETGYPGEPSNGGGGGGGFTTPHDPIEPPTETPDIGELYSSRLVTCMKISNQDLITLAGSLWTNADEIGEYFKKLFTNPMDAIIHLFAVPYDPPAVGSFPIILGNYNTGANGSLLAGGYVNLNCGTVTIDEFWGNALDYNNSKLILFLPFVGEIPLGKNCLGASIHVEYHIENSTGSFIAFVSCEKNGAKWIESKHTGNCAIDIPLTAQDWHVLENVLAMGGNITGIALNPANVGGIVSNSIGMVSQVVNMSKPEIKSTGQFRGNIGAFDNLEPYITIYRPVWQEPDGFDHFKGYPSNITATLGELSGYTEIEYVHLDHITATDEEKRMIENALRNGVIL